jgi:hypothetical protein
MISLSTEPAMGDSRQGQPFTVDKTALARRIGNVSSDRVRQILDGVSLLTEPRDVA